MSLNKICLASAVLALFSGTVHARPYASKVRLASTSITAGAGTEITYNLNEPADSVTIEIKNASTDATVATFPGTTTRGPNAVLWNGTADNAAGSEVIAGSYKIVITANKNNTAWTEIASQRSLALAAPAGVIYEQVYNGFSPNDALFVEDTASDFFGDLYSNVSYYTATVDQSAKAAIKFRSDLAVADGTNGYASRILKVSPTDEASTANNSSAYWIGSLDPDSSNILYYTGQLQPAFWYGDLNNPALLSDGDPNDYLGTNVPRSVVVVRESPTSKYAYFTNGFAILKAPMNGNLLSGPPVTVADFTSANRYSRNVTVDSAGNLYWVSRALGTASTAGAGNGGVLLRWDRTVTLGDTPSLTEANASWTVSAESGMEYMAGPAISSADGNVYVGFATGSTVINPTNGAYLVGNTSSATIVRTLSGADRVVDTAAMSWGISNIYFHLRTDSVGNLLLIDRQKEQLRLYTPGGISNLAIEAPTSQQLTIAPRANVGTWALYE